MMNSTTLTHRHKQHVQCMVLAIEQVSPHMRRIVLGGPELSAWLSNPAVQEPGAWIKIFPPAIKGRAYTIRDIDYHLSTISIDFVLHGHELERGTVSGWARQCSPGDCLSIAGPRSGQFILEDDTSWIWMAVDLTALPAAIRIIQTLPKELNVYGLFVVDDLKDKQEIRTSASVHCHWRRVALFPEMPITKKLLTDEIKSLSGKGQIWIAGEANWVKSWKTFWQENKTVDYSTLSCKGYWKLGEQDYRD